VQHSSNMRPAESGKHQQTMTAPPAESIQVRGLTSALRARNRLQKVGGSNPSGRASDPCSGAIFLALNGASTRRIGHFVARGAPSYRIKINASADPLPAFLPTPALPVAFT